MVSHYHQTAKPFAQVVLAWRMADASTALFISLSQLGQGRKHDISAIAAAFPDGIPFGGTLLRWFQRHQLSKPLSGNIPLTGPHFCDTAAILNSPSLQCPCVQGDCSAANAGTQPNRIPIFTRTRVVHNCEVSQSISRFDYGTFALFHNLTPIRLIHA